MENTLIHVQPSEDKLAYRADVPIIQLLASPNEHA